MQGCMSSFSPGAKIFHAIAKSFTRGRCESPFDDRVQLVILQDRTAQGIVFLCLGVFTFTIQDAIIKNISGIYPVTQVVAIRSLVALPILAGIVQVEIGLKALFSPRAGWLTLRAFTLFLSYTTYYLAFPVLPLAEAVALFFTAPLLITVLAGPVLAEKIGWRSWAAITVGLAGVVIMLRPGTALFEPAAVLSLLSALLYAAAALMTRRLGIAEKASVMTFYSVWVYLAAAIGLAVLLQGAEISTTSHPSLSFLLRPWGKPTGSDFLLMAACGVIAAIAMTLLTNAYRAAPANIVAPFEYTGILWLPLWGFMFFSEIPRWTTALGALLIIASGIAVLRQPKASNSSN
jgi:drug/metabolite transporter (DMT)-like permease